MSKTCKNCGKRIVEITYALGKEWTHQPEGASFSDGVHKFCEISIAEPEVNHAQDH